MIQKNKSKILMINKLYIKQCCLKYAWVVPLKDKRGIAITNAFQNFLKESNKKPNKT